METTLKSSSQDMSVSVLMINDKGLMISVLGQDYFLSYNRIPWMRSKYFGCAQRTDVRTQRH